MKPDVEVVLKSLRHRTAPTIVVAIDDAVENAIAVLLAPVGRAWGMEVAPFVSARQHWADIAEPAAQATADRVRELAGASGFDPQELPSWILGEFQRAHATIPLGSSHRIDEMPYWTRFHVLPNSTDGALGRLKSFLQDAIQQLGVFALPPEHETTEHKSTVLQDLFHVQTMSDDSIRGLYNRWKYLTPSDYQELDQFSKDESTSLLSAWFLFVDPIQLPLDIASGSLLGQASASILQASSRMLGLAKGASRALDEARSAHFRLKLLEKWDWPLGLWNFRKESYLDDPAWENKISALIRTHGHGSDLEFRRRIRAHVAAMRSRYPVIFESVT